MKFQSLTAMKNIFLPFFILCTIAATAQYNNSWIDYSKPYYKFKVGKNGLYRISQSVLASAGLGNTPAEHFQLWRNGEEVRLYTSVASGVLGVDLPPPVGKVREVRAVRRG